MAKLKLRSETTPSESAVLQAWDLANTVGAIVTIIPNIAVNREAMKENWETIRQNMGEPAVFAAKAAGSGALSAVSWSVSGVWSGIKSVGTGIASGVGATVHYGDAKEVDLAMKGKNDEKPT